MSPLAMVLVYEDCGVKLGPLACPLQALIFCHLLQLADPRSSARPFLYRTIFGVTWLRKA